MTTLYQRMQKYRANAGLTPEIYQTLIDALKAERNRVYGQSARNGTQNITL